MVLPAAHLVACGCRGAELSLQLAAFVAESRVNGPGVRSVVWTQGCPLRCPGCFNPDFQPFAGGTPTPVEELATRLLAVAGTEGVTFSGGEPFAQAGPVAAVAAACRAAGKGVVVFTGYEYAELRAGEGEGWRALLEVADLLVAGPYREGEPGRHALLASANQELVFLTGRYRGFEFGRPRRRIEYRIGTGAVTTTGFPGRR